MPRSIVLKVSLALASTLGALGLAELAMATWLPQDGGPDRRAEAWANLVHRRSKTPGLLYELKPNARRVYRPPKQEGVQVPIPITVNRHGMRSPDVELKKGDRLRVAVLGDSTTFGYGVRDDESYPAVLQTTLAVRDRSREYEVLNFGVAGYNTADEAAVLAHKALRFRPDVIVVGYNLNDPDAESQMPLHAHFRPQAWWESFHLARYVAAVARRPRFKELGYDDPIHYWHAEGGANWAVVEDGFRRIAELADGADIPVVVVIFTVGPPTESPETYAMRDVHDQVAREAIENGFDVIDLSIEYARLTASGLVTQLSHDHPNVLGHRAAADAIADYLLDEGGPFHRPSER